MPTRFVSGDLFAIPGLDGLGHGCNCTGAMGRGIAVEFRRRYPDMYRAFRRACAEGRFGLGDVFPWLDTAPVVFNLGTQRTWRTRAELDAIRRSVHTMLGVAEARGLRSVGLPRVGAGLGGLPWEPVRAILEEAGGGTAIDLVVVETYASAS